MRGKGKNDLQGGMLTGITPAYAGKRTSPPYAAPGDQDHPRVCGEKFQVFDLNQCHWGSPPRMRGKDESCIGFLGLLGITPAYAGKSCSTSFFLFSPWDHPRVCGEKIKSDDNGVTQTGSPPRMRGKAPG